jgi:hypothetical protein
VCATFITLITIIGTLILWIIIHVVLVHLGLLDVIRYALQDILTTSVKQRVSGLFVFVAI